MNTNLLHLNNDILNVMGDYVNKDKIRFNQELYNIPFFI
jgi:hypothetical protein